MDSVPLLMSGVGDCVTAPLQNVEVVCLRVSGCSKGSLPIVSGGALIAATKEAEVAARASGTVEATLVLLDELAGEPALPNVVADGAYRWRTGQKHRSHVRRRLHVLHRHRHDLWQLHVLQWRCHGCCWLHILHGRRGRP